MKVTNINGINQNPGRGESWLSYWISSSQQSLPKYCPVDGCYEKITVAVLVQKDNSTDEGWYIIPLCNLHSTNANSLKVGDYVTLVSAGVGESEATNFEDSIRHRFGEHVPKSLQRT